MLAFLCGGSFWFPSRLLVLSVVAVSSVRTFDRPLCPNRKPIPLWVRSSDRTLSIWSFHTLVLSTNSGLWTGPRLSLGGVYASALLSLFFNDYSSVRLHGLSIIAFVLDSALYASGDSMGGRSARGGHRAGGLFSPLPLLPRPSPRPCPQPPPSSPLSCHPHTEELAI
jgi:hypothetical protein